MSLHFHFKIISQLSMESFVVFSDLEEIVLRLVEINTRLINHCDKNWGFTFSCEQNWSEKAEGLYSGFDVARF